MPTSGWSIACSPARSTASAGPGTGSTWCAMPSPTATSKTPIAPKPGAIATTSSARSTPTSPTRSSSWSSSPATRPAPGDPDALDRHRCYLRLGIYEYNQRDVRNQWSIILNDLTDVTADVFLGMGMSCARCHDHKFDPILQKDYYRLQAFFAPILWRENVPAATADELAEYQRQLAVWEEATADVRRQIAEIEDPIRRSAMKTTLVKFPDDLQAMLAKPPAERTPLRGAARLPRRLPGDRRRGQSRHRREAQGREEGAVAKAEEASWPSSTRTAAASPFRSSPHVTDVGPVAPEVTIPGRRSDSSGGPLTCGTDRARPAQRARSRADDDSTAARITYDRPPHGAGPVDRLARQSAAVARAGQSPLAVSLRPRPVRSRPAISAAWASRRAIPSCSTSWRASCSITTGRSSACTGRWSRRPPTARRRTARKSPPRPPKTRSIKWLGPDDRPPPGGRADSRCGDRRQRRARSADRRRRRATGARRPAARSISRCFRNKQDADARRVRRAGRHLHDARPQRHDHAHAVAVHDQRPLDDAAGQGASPAGSKRLVRDARASASPTAYALALRPRA